MGLAALAFAVAATAAAPAIPLCAGLTIVTAVEQESGDYESIKRITAVGPDRITLHYSNERLEADFLSSDPPKKVRYEMERQVRTADLDDAPLYLQQFDPLLPPFVPGTTAISISRKVFRRLKAGETVELGIFLPFSQRPSLDRDEHPNVWDNAMVTPVTRTRQRRVAFPVVLDSKPVRLPAIEVSGDFFGDPTQLLVLDDERNPLVLQYRFGVGNRSVDPALAAALGISATGPSDRERFDVIKISTECERATPGAPPPSAKSADPAGSGLDGASVAMEAAGVDAGVVSAMADALEARLGKDGKAELHAVYFAFASAELRPESAPALAAAATMMKRNPSWRIAINGHTDSVGGEAANLSLSQNRAAAVMAALTERFAIERSRMHAAGFGEAAPIDDNATPAGRARNRRVEIIRE